MPVVPVKFVPWSGKKEWRCGVATVTVEIIFFSCRVW